MLRSPLQRPEDQHVEGALQELEPLFVVHGAFGHSRRESTALDVGRLLLVQRLYGTTAKRLVLRRHGLSIGDVGERLGDAWLTVGVTAGLLTIVMVVFAIGR